MQILGYVPIGYEGITVSVEVDIRRGIPGTEIVGMAGPPVREARERVRVALKNSGYEYPADRILINLSPADLPKVGSGFDLAIAIAVLVASGQLSCPELRSLLAVGELGLDGSLRRVPGVIAAVAAARTRRIPGVAVPEANVSEAVAVARGWLVHGVHLREVVDELKGGPGARRSGSPDGPKPPGASGAAPQPALSFEQLRSNPRGLRALLIAAAGRHNLLLTGPPGSGKTVLARSLPALLPPLGWAESLEVTRIHSQAGVLSPENPLVRQPPFRAPHHSATSEGVVGGGAKVLPGEISLAHHGVLFLDEALEFRKNVLQSLREPLERRRVYLARAGRTFWYPADFQLILACNACPCGNLGKPGGQCSCSFDEIARYWRRLGGPLLDRIALRVPFGSEAARDDFDNPQSLEEARERLRSAAKARAARGPRPSEDGSALSEAGREILRRATGRFGLSHRGRAATISVARTIADLDGCPAVGEKQLLEALAHRSFLEGPEAHPAFFW